MFQIGDNPLKWSPADIRAKLEGLNLDLSGLNLEDMALKFYEKIKGIFSLGHYMTDL